MGVVADLLKDADTFARQLLDEEVSDLETLRLMIDNAILEKKGLPPDLANAGADLADLEAEVAEDKKFGRGDG